MLRFEEYPHDENELWRMVYVKAEGATTSKLLKIKNNLLSLPEPEYNNFMNITSIWHLLRKNRNSYCNECDFIYNLPPCIIYTIPEEDKPISNCASELDSSSALNSNEIYNDSNFNSNPETFITLSDLTKKQELKWFSNNGKGIMPKHVHNTDAEFNLRYPGKDAIKLEPHSRTCIDLKIALEIPATTMVQLSSRSSLAKKGITIRGGIIDAKYVGNIMAMLQNDSEKIYIIEPNEKIAQAIFLFLVRVAQLILVRKREELGITAERIQGFEFMDRIDVPVNMAEEEVIGQREIISTGQVISIPPYDQYMVIIEKKVKDKDQIFEAETSLYVITIPEETIVGYISTELKNQPPSIIPNFLQLCGYVVTRNTSGNCKDSLRKNLRQWVDFSLASEKEYINTHNNQESRNNLHCDIKKKVFSITQLNITRRPFCNNMNITLQTIYRRNKCYLLQPKQLEQMNMGNLDPLQCIQLKILFNNFNDIFASENKFGKTNII
ncbi:hypothetical protein G9A89_016908 [Geosiphon pyriformis]|nr:hypothetical protein G9A89_016908 [Geosiphon pyriformis]